MKPVTQPKRIIRRGKELVVDPQIELWRKRKALAKARAEAKEQEAATRARLTYKPLFE